MSDDDDIRPDTPTPWRTADKGGSMFALYAADRRKVIGTFVNTDDLAFAALACSSHDILVRDIARLRMLLTDINDHEGPIDEALQSRIKRMLKEV